MTNSTSNSIRNAIDSLSDNMDPNDNIYGHDSTMLDFGNDEESQQFDSISFNF